MFKELTKRQRDDIKYILSESPELIPIFDSELKIPQKVNNFDKNAFIVWNRKKQQYELHSIESYSQREGIKGHWTTFQANLNYEMLDNRILKYMYDNSFILHGDSVMDNITYEYEIREKIKEEFMDEALKLQTTEILNGLNGRVITY